MIPGGKYGRHVRCKVCSLIYVNPIAKVSKINQDYSQRKNLDVPIVTRARLRAAKAQLELVKKFKTGVRLLDVGCGEGFFLFHASRCGYVTKGVELSQGAAAHAQRNFGLDIDVGPFEDLTFPANHFDVITMWQVLEHLPYPSTVLREAYRILSPGGMLVVTTPDIESPLARIFGKKWWNIRMLHVNQFSAKTLRSMLENAGFKNIATVSYQESISLLMLFITTLKYFRLHQPLKKVFSLDSPVGRVLNSVILGYPSKLDNCTVLGFKQGDI